MTTLKKPVTRRTMETHDHRRRRLVVTLFPGEGTEPSFIGIREERARQMFVAPVAAVYRQLAQWHIDALRRMGRKARR